MNNGTYCSHIIIGLEQMNMNRLSLCDCHGEMSPCYDGKFQVRLMKSNSKLVGGLEHFLFFHILGIIIPID